MVNRGQSVIVGMGDPVMDILARVDSAFLASVCSEPGGCTPVTPDEMAGLLEATAKTSHLKRIPGGSAANVMKGLANVSRQTSQCKFMGMVAIDTTGAQYRTDLFKHGVRPLLLDSYSGQPSACALCWVTPDGQRTMRTCLGASLELQHTQQLPANWCENIRLLHCEGYCLYRSQFTREVMEIAKRQGALVSVDLASFELVRNCKNALLELLKAGCIDLVFANEEEAVTLAVELYLTPKDASYEGKVAAAQDFILKYAQMSVVSMGARGCQARHRDGRSATCPAPTVTVVDTIGAGDCFTAGFLFAYLQNCDLGSCCKAGCAAGGMAVQTEGAELNNKQWAALQREMDGIISSSNCCSNGDTPAHHVDHVTAVTGKAESVLRTPTTATIFVDSLE